MLFICADEWLGSLFAHIFLFASFACFASFSFSFYISFSLFARAFCARIIIFQKSFLFLHPPLFLHHIILLASLLLPHIKTVNRPVCMAPHICFLSFSLFLHFLSSFFHKIGEDNCNKSKRLHGRAVMCNIIYHQYIISNIK